MKDAVVNFSLGTTGALPLPPVHKRQFKGTRGPVKVKLASRSESATSRASDDSYTKRDDGVLIEELKLPDVMIRNISHETPTYTEDTSPRVVDGSKFQPRKLFLSGFQEAITKKDQFAKLKAFENDIIRKQDTKEKYVLTGIKAVEHLERKLKEVQISLIS